MRSFGRYILLGGATAALAYLMYKHVKARWFHRNNFNQGFAAIEIGPENTPPDKNSTTKNRPVSPYRSPVFHKIEDDLNRYNESPEVKDVVMNMLNNLEEKNLDFAVKLTLDKLLTDVEKLVADPSSQNHPKRTIEYSESIFSHLKQYLPENLNNVEPEPKKTKKRFKKARNFFKTISCVRKYD